MIEVNAQIQSFLKDVSLATNDEDVQDYLLKILQDEESYEDPDALVEQLLPFWGNDQQEQIQKWVHDLASQLRQNGTDTTCSSGGMNTNAGYNPSASSAMNIAQAGKNDDYVAPSLRSESNQVSERKLCQDDDNGNDRKDVASSSLSSTSPLRLKKSHERRQRREQRRKAKMDGNSSSKNDPDSSSQQQQQQQHLLEDQASAWQECLNKGITWGGRGKGGRGEYAGAVNSIKSNIHLSNVSICLDNGTELLHGSTMDIVKGHRYGLIGRNGVGKSTLLRRLAQKAIPGMPLDMRILLVQQEIEGNSDSALQVLLSADIDRNMLLREQEELEARLESVNISEDDLRTIAERLGDVASELDAIGAGTAEDRANEILKGLQFTADMISGPTSNLSGGWRMRLALAAALFVQSDLLLFDECTNHLDLYGLSWLINYLEKEEDRTLIVVSHDRAFLDAVCTDIVVMEHQRLQYHVGNFSEYERQQQEKAAREAQILDATERQRSKAQAFVQKQQAQANKKSADPNKQRQAKMIKEKKLDRLGNYREDGKRYKLRSLKKLSEDHLRLAQKVVIENDEPIIKMKFPDPVWPPSVGPNGAIVQLEDFSFSYEGSERTLLNHITLSLHRGSKVAFVGRNGSGKSSLCKLIAGEITAGGARHDGDLWIHPNLKIGHITQYSVEELEVYSNLTVAEYATEQLRTKKASAEIIAKAYGNVRQYLGAFGLGGKHATQKIGSLSGGERMRLCFATVLADEPHLLLLDESTNHVDIETLSAMSEALNDYQGSVLMVSHNQAFLSGFCKELWVLEDGGRIPVTYSDTESFDEIFSAYRSSISGGRLLRGKSRQKAARAAQAAKHRAGANESTALL